MAADEKDMYRYRFKPSTLNPQYPTINSPFSTPNLSPNLNAAHVMHAAAPGPARSNTFGGTLVICLVIATILGVTYFAAKPPPEGDQSAIRGDYATLDQVCVCARARSCVCLWSPCDGAW